MSITTTSPGWAGRCSTGDELGHAPAQDRRARASTSSAGHLGLGNADLELRPVGQLRRWDDRDRGSEAEGLALVGRPVADVHLGARHRPDARRRRRVPEPAVQVAANGLLPERLSADAGGDDLSRAPCPCESRECGATPRGRRPHARSRAGRPPPAPPPPGVRGSRAALRPSSSLRAIVSERCRSPGHGPSRGNGLPGAARNLPVPTTRPRHSAQTRTGVA